jgi:hypothetical protein
LQRASLGYAAFASRPLQYEGPQLCQLPADPGRRRMRYGHRRPFFLAAPPRPTTTLASSSTGHAIYDMPSLADVKVAGPRGPAKAAPAQQRQDNKHTSRSRLNFGIVRRPQHAGTE